jgi:recombination protein RecR
MNPFNRLTELFAEFPGIGPRQARRFAYFLLAKNEGFSKELASLVEEVRKSMKTCSSCFRYFQAPPRRMAAQANTSDDEWNNAFTASKEESLCSICRDQNRDHSSLMIVARDNDLDTIEKSRTYNGYYFVLGGTVPILEDEPEARVRSRELSKRAGERCGQGLKEIIVSLSLNPEGENTEQYIRNILKPLVETHQLKISTLGRGLSTGTEIEYSDKETLKNALANRQ